MRTALGPLAANRSEGVRGGELCGATSWGVELQSP